jgi:MFS family permease
MVPAIIVAEKRNAQKPFFIAAIVIMMVSMFVLGNTQGSILTFLMLFSYFAAFNLLEAFLPSWLSKVSPAGNRGTAMGIYSTCQFLGTFAGGILGGWGLTSLGVDGLLILLAMLLLVWVILATQMTSPRPMQTMILHVGKRKPNEFIKSVSTIVGVEDILLLEGDDLAYIKVDKTAINVAELQPFLNRT